MRYIYLLLCVLIIAWADNCIRFTQYDGDSRSIIMPGCKDINCAWSAMLSGCKDNRFKTSRITWSIILSEFANLSLPILAHFSSERILHCIPAYNII